MFVVSVPCPMDYESMMVFVCYCGLEAAIENLTIRD